MLHFSSEMWGGVAFVTAARLDRDGRAKPLEPELVIYFSEQSGQALGL